MGSKKNKSGFSLVELMIAILVLLFLIVGGAMVLYTTGADIQVYGNKRVALELARTELEALLATDYDTLRDAAVAGSPQTGARTETWNNVSMAINWTNRLVAAGGILDNEYLALDVSVTYEAGTDQAVLLQATKTISP